MERIRVSEDGLDVHLLGVCLGLEGEAEAVVEAIESLDPSVVALAVGPQTVEGVSELEPARALGAEDEAYKRGLSEFGQVTLPAPAFPAALEAADRLEAEVEGVDMSQADFVDLHLDEVGVLELVKRALRARWLVVRPPTADSPAGFCRAFDERVNVGPFQRLEEARERSMAANVRALEADTVVLVVEVERLEGVTRGLRARPRADLDRSA